MGKLSFVVGFAAGYVAGAAAGRQRYEQIRSSAQKVLQNPKVQQTTSKVQSQATDLVGKGKSKVNERVESRKSGAGTTGTTGTTTGTDTASTYDVVEIPPTTTADPFGSTGSTTGTGYGTSSTTDATTGLGGTTTGLGTDDPTLDRPGPSGL